MMVRPALRLAAIAAGVVALAACAGLPRFAHLAPVRAITPPTGASIASRQDGYYASAKAAIAKRDYQSALELLQAARDLKPDDVRIVNAFGVVYDKLGRFDLSQRYYAQAMAIDPTSQILANNLAYSAILRSDAARSVDAPPVTLALATPVRAPVSPPLPMPVVHLAALAPSALPTITLAGQSHPVVIANASGRLDGTEPVRQTLVRLGWTKPVIEARALHRAAVTTITYPAQSAAIAQALAHTLPRGVELIDCGSDCNAVRVTIGLDAARWPLKIPQVLTP